MFFLGDGICDDFANIKGCLYDKGDCCHYANYSLSHSQCSDCFCYVNMSTFYGTLNCYEKVVTTTGDHRWTADLGNGFCNLHLNNVDKLFDAGDCCLDKMAKEDDCKKSNIYCHSETIGDGKCHDNNNGPLCDYDLGDCCVHPGQMNTTECCRCDCHSHINYYFWDDYKIG